MFCKIFKPLTVLVCFIFFGMPTLAFSQEKSTSGPELTKLFNNSGGKRIAIKFEKHLLAKYSKKLSSIYEKIPEEFWDDFFEVMTPDDEIESIIESTLSVYGKNFTAEEIHVLNRYFKVPVLQKWAELSPKITKEQLMIVEKKSKALLADAVFNEKLGRLGEKYVFYKGLKTIRKKEVQK